MSIILEYREGYNTLAEDLSLATSPVTMPLNTLRKGSELCTLRGNQFMLPVGTWKIEGVFHGEIGAPMIPTIYNATTGEYLARGLEVLFQGRGSRHVTIDIEFESQAQKDLYELRFIFSVEAAFGFGQPHLIEGYDNIYAQFRITEVEE
jgi:hypothetical protein